MSVPMMIYAYWTLAFLVGLLFFRKDILTFNREFDTRRVVLIVASFVVVAINAWVYSHSTTDGGRPLDPLTVVIFSVCNGIAETFMFYAVFRLGDLLASKLSSDNWQLTPKQSNFIIAMLFFVAYSGLIHGLFWINILPEHVVQTSPYKPFFMPIQMLIAGSWALSFFLVP